MTHSCPSQPNAARRRADCDPENLLKHLSTSFQYEGDLSSIVGGDERRRISLICPTHGAFTARLCVIRKHFSTGHCKLACPTCGKLSHAEKSAESRIAAARRGESATALRKSIQRLSSQGLHFDWEQYRGYNHPWFGTCHTHGKFNLNTAGELLRKRIPCPNCADSIREQEHFEQRLPYIVRFAQGGASPAVGGWLYQVFDAGSSRRYWGITKRTVEERWRRHLHDAARGKKGHLYDAMRKRPADFKVEAVAYFFSQAELASAEKTRIKEERSKWPLGYNASAGGQLGAPRAPSVVQRALAECKNEADFALLSTYRHAMARNGIDLQSIRRRVLSGMTVLQALKKPMKAKAPHPVSVRGVSYPTIAAAVQALDIPPSIVVLGHEKGLNFSELFESYLSISEWFNPSRPFGGHWVSSWEDAFKITGFTTRSLAYTMVRAGLRCPQDALEYIAKENGIIQLCPDGSVRLYASARRACLANSIPEHKIESLLNGRIPLTRQQAFDRIISIAYVG